MRQKSKPELGLHSLSLVMIWDYLLLLERKIRMQAENKIKPSVLSTMHRLERGISELRFKILVISLLELHLAKSDADVFRSDLSVKPLLIRSPFPLIHPLCPAG